MIIKRRKKRTERKIKTIQMKTKNPRKKPVNLRKTMTPTMSPKMINEKSLNLNQRFNSYF